MIKYGVTIIVALSLEICTYLFAFGLTGMGEGSVIPVEISGAPNGLFYLMYPVLACLVRNRRTWIRSIVHCGQCVQLLSAAYYLIPLSKTYRDYDKLISYGSVSMVVLHSGGYILMHALLIYWSLRAVLNCSSLNFTKPQP